MNIGRGLRVVLLGAATLAGVVALQLDDHSGTSRSGSSTTTAPPVDRTTTTTRR